MNKIRFLSIALVLSVLLSAWPMMAAAQTPDEVWRLGMTVEGTVGYDAVIGRVASEATAFRSNRDVSDIFFVFPAPATQRTVTSARFYLLGRSGSYSGAAGMTLEIRNFAGAVQHTVSSSAVNMASAPVGAWTVIALSGTPANLVVSPGEYLVFHFNLDSGPGGTLDARPIFEVEVQ